MALPSSPILAAMLRMKQPPHAGPINPYQPPGAEGSGESIAPIHGFGPGGGVVGRPGLSLLAEAFHPGGHAGHPAEGIHLPNIGGGVNPGGFELPAGAPPPGAHVDTGYNPAAYQRSIGNTGQAATDWEAHHPYAMSHPSAGMIPDWVANYEASQLPRHGLGSLVGAAGHEYAPPRRRQSLASAAHPATAA